MSILSPKDSNSTDSNKDTDTDYAHDDDSDDGTEIDVVDRIDLLLDFERDTIEEVTNIINLHPEVFNDDPPQVTNDDIALRSTPFIPSVLLSICMDETL